MLSLLNMSLFNFVLLYLIFSIIVGILAGIKIKTSSDFVNAGRNLSMPFVMAMVFATWFGSEAVLGMPAEFIKEGFAGIIKDPFGAFFCLSIVGFLIAKRWYRQNVFTLAEIYEKRFGKIFGIIMSIAIIMSYFGWVAAQMSALGVVINVLSYGAVSKEIGILLAGSVVLLYTLSGGMLSIAFNDFFQMFIIAISLLFLLYFFTDLSGGFGNIIEVAQRDNMFVFIHDMSPSSFLTFFGALFTMMLGSMPQQDIFQRVNSAKSEKTAKYGMISGATMYLLFCLIPIVLVTSAKIIDPNLINFWISENSEMILPTYIMKHTPFWAQVLFFGALISAIMSTASGTLMAPSVTLTENIIKKLVKNMDDKKYLLSLRITILLAGIIIIVFAIRSTSSIYEMVGDAYKITLVTAVSPMFGAMFWKRATSLGAYMSVILSLIVWISLEKLHVPQPQLFGFFTSAISMILFSYMSKKQDAKIYLPIIKPGKVSHVKN